MLLGLGSNLRKRASGAVPFIRAASKGTVSAARNNKGVVVSFITLILLLICIAAIFVLRSAAITEAVSFSLSQDVQMQILGGPQINEEEKNPKSLRTPLSSVSHHTYAMDTISFINEIKATERLQGQVFDWHSEGPLQYAKWSPKNPFMKIMAVGNMHARELFTADVVRLWMSAIISTHKKSTSNDTFLPSWVFVPVANPCGRDMVAKAYNAVMRGDSNRTELWNVCHRGNCADVDLNRNWITYRSSLYKKTSSLRLKRGRHWDGAPESNPGPEAFSEDENKALRSLLHSEKPDFLLSVHSGGVGFFHAPEDGDNEEDLHANFSPQRLAELDRLSEWARRKMGSLTRKRQKKLIDGTLPIAGGSMVDYASKHDVPLALTLEVYVGHPDNAFEGEPQDEAYHGREHWGQDPMNCHTFYNPPQDHLLESANSWIRLWQACHYLRGSSRALFQDLLSHGTPSPDDSNHPHHK